MRGKAAKPVSTHDRKVQEIARTLTKQGYKVCADLPGREMPNRIAKKFVPDIEATKDGRKLIVEVETPKSLVKDKEQLKTFARHAGQKPNTTLRVVVTKPRKQ